MSGQSYSKEILVSVKPETVYKALTKEIDKWWTELSNQAVHAGDRLTVRFEKTTSWVMIVSEASPNQYLTWKVTEANHDLEGVFAKDEWKGTSIKWKIEKESSGSKITLTHEGLIPALECYEICQTGWDYFLGSLKNFLESGKGNPYKA
jgi:uncharacterized protein YndB with AHSA1/START domain